MEDDIFAALGNPTAEQLDDMTKARSESHALDFAENRKEFIASAIKVIGELSNDTKRIGELAIILGDIGASRFCPPKRRFDENDNSV